MITQTHQRNNIKTNPTRYNFPTAFFVDFSFDRFIHWPYQRFSFFFWSSTYSTCNTMYASVCGCSLYIIDTQPVQNGIIWCVCLHLFLSSLFLSLALRVCVWIVVPVSDGTFVHTQTPAKANLFSSQDIFMAFFFWCLSRTSFMTGSVSGLIWQAIQFTAMNKSQRDQIESTAHTLQFIRRYCFERPGLRKSKFPLFDSNAKNGNKFQF